MNSLSVADRYGNTIAKKMLEQLQLLARAKVMKTMDFPAEIVSKILQFAVQSDDFIVNAPSQEGMVQFASSEMKRKATLMSLYVSKSYGAILAKTFLRNNRFAFGGQIYFNKFVKWARMMHGAENMIVFGMVEVIIFEKFNHFPELRKFIQSCNSFRFEKLHVNIISECGNIFEDGTMCGTFITASRASKADFEGKIGEEISGLQAGDIIISGLPGDISQEINGLGRDNNISSTSLQKYQMNKIGGLIYLNEEIADVNEDGAEEEWLERCRAWKASHNK